jgi:hypothetical protein
MPTHTSAVKDSEHGSTDRTRTTSERACRAQFGQDARAGGHFLAGLEVDLHRIRGRLLGRALLGRAAGLVAQRAQAPTCGGGCGADLAAGQTAVMPPSTV